MCIQPSPDFLAVKTNFFEDGPGATERTRRAAASLPSLARLTAALASASTHHCAAFSPAPLEDLRDSHRLSKRRWQNTDGSRGLDAWDLPIRSDLRWEGSLQTPQSLTRCRGRRPPPTLRLVSARRSEGLRHCACQSRVRLFLRPSSQRVS